jgi:hypothetical protein
MTWLGHKRIDETMRYVHVADSHRRDLPPEVLAAAEGELDPDRRILKLLGGRANLRQPDGNTNKAHENLVGFQHLAAGWTGLEPAASGVTGRRYNQLNYHPMIQFSGATVGGAGFEPATPGL